MTSRTRRSTVAAILVVCGFATYASAQFGRGSGAAQLAPRLMPDRDFVVCRLVYQSVRSEPSEAGRWQT